MASVNEEWVMYLFIHLCIFLNNFVLPYAPYCTDTRDRFSQLIISAMLLKSMISYMI